MSSHHCHLTTTQTPLFPQLLGEMRKNMFQHVMCRFTDLPTSSGTAVVQHLVSCSVFWRIKHTKQ